MEKFLQVPGVFPDGKEGIMGNDAIEKKIKFLFGLQRFVQDPELKQVIDETENSMKVVRLSDFDLEGVSAGVDKERNGLSQGQEYCLCPLCSKMATRYLLPSGMYHCTNCDKDYYDQ